VEGEKALVLAGHHELRVDRGPRNPGVISYLIVDDGRAELDALLEGVAEDGAIVGGSDGGERLDRHVGVLALLVPA
jgi:hypothetical protein